jgi:hypothetical protein
MKKLYPYIIYILFICIGLAFGFFINNSIPRAMAAVGACEDADDGLDYYTSGIVSVNDAYSQGTYYDICEDSTILTERYCGSNGGAQSASYTCPYGCDNGACIQGVTITSPNNRQIWYEGDVHRIEWEHGGLYNRISLRYKYDDSQWIRIAYNLPVLDGYYDWKIPEGIVDQYPGSTGVSAKISVVWNENIEISDESDEYIDIERTSIVQNEPPVIDEFAGPTNLSVNEKGAWKIEARDMENGDLSYLIDWGDMSGATSGTVSRPTQSIFVKSAYFTHAYSRAGKYTVKITISDDENQIVESTVNVSVEGQEEPILVRDLERHGNLRSAELALELYYAAHGEYPPADNIPNLLVAEEFLLDSSAFIDPSTGNQYCYAVGNETEGFLGNQYYQLAAKLEDVNSSLLNDDHDSSPDTISKTIKWTNNSLLITDCHYAPKGWIMGTNDSVDGIYDYGLLPQTCNYRCYPEGSLLRVPNDYKVYAIRDGKKMWIESQEQFQQQGYKWEDVQETTVKVLNSYDSAPLLQKDARLLKETGGLMVYYITESGMKRHIPTIEVFNSYGNKWENIVEVDRSIIDAYEDNILIRTDGDSKVYQLYYGIRRWIKTAEAFNRLGYDWNKIAPINATELEAYQEEAPIE